MRRRRVLICALSEGRWQLAAEQMDLSGFADIHPKPGNAREIRQSSIGDKPKKALVKLEIGGKAGCVPVDPYPMVVNLDNVYRHVLTLPVSICELGVCADTK